MGSEDITLRRNLDRPVYPYHKVGCFAENDCHCERSGYKRLPSMAELEQAVVEAAAIWRKAERARNAFWERPLSDKKEEELTQLTNADAVTYVAFCSAVDALIAARESNTEVKW